MKKTTGIWVLMVLFWLQATLVWAETPSVELGRKLFGNPGLGFSENSLSCASCHPNGDGLENAAANPQLVAMINRCIRGPLKGKIFSANSTVMQSLKMYIESLAP